MIEGSHIDNTFVFEEKITNSNIQYHLVIFRVIYYFHSFDR